MSLEKSISNRSGDACELCSNTENLQLFTVAPKKGLDVSELVHTCGTCFEQLENSEKVDANHWRCLNDSMWSEVPAVKVIAYRMLDQLKAEGWPADLLEMMYLDEDTLAWAKEGIEDTDGEAIVHRDCNGIVLNTGDSVVVIKDLNVKGSSLTAKRGTAVRNIRLVHDNPEHIEGKVDGQNIVILTKYVKK